MKLSFYKEINIIKEMVIINKLKLVSLFSGIGAYEEALKNLGIDFDVVNYCEVDETPASAYSVMHGVDKNLNLGDITKVDETKIEDFDLMTYSFPCQDLSALGNQNGLFKENGEKTRSGLFFDAIRIAQYKKPKYMVAENVKALATKKFKNDLENMVKLLDEIGYNTYWKVLDSKDYGIPHSRNRIYIVSIRKDVDDGSFKFPEPIKLIKMAKDFYDKGIVDDQYYLRESDMKYLSEFRLKKKYSSINSDVIVCQTTKQGNLANPQNFIQDEKGYRVMTPRELLSLQGFKSDYGDLLLESGFTKEKIGKMSGNSVTVDVLYYIFKNLFKIK